MVICSGDRVLFLLPEEVPDSDISNFTELIMWLLSGYPVSK